MPADQLLGGSKMATGSPEMAARHFPSLTEGAKMDAAMEETSLNGKFKAH